MKTTIQLKTFMCPTGLGNPNADCRFHRAENNLPEDNMCPDCKEELVQSTHPEDKITITIMGEDELDTHEIIDETKPKDESGNRPLRKLKASEKTAMRDKINADITKFKALEDI